MWWRCRRMWLVFCCHWSRKSLWPSVRLVVGSADANIFTDPVTRLELAGASLPEGPARSYLRRCVSDSEGAHAPCPGRWGAPRNEGVAGGRNLQLDTVTPAATSQRCHQSLRSQQLSNGFGWSVSIRSLSSL